MDVADLSELAVRLCSASPGDRALVEWDICKDVVRHAADYSPADFEMPGEWGEADHRHVNGMRNVKDLSELRTVAEVRSSAFGRWRDEVMNHEAREANKLQTVLWCLRVLYVLRDRGEFNEQVADQIALKLGTIISMEWKCKSVPLEGDYRQWAITETRRYDLLPKSWRYA